MAIEDFTTYTEVDPSSDLTKDSNTIDWTAVNSRDDDARVYKDFGVDHFDGDFEWLYEWEVTASSAEGALLFTPNLTNSTVNVRTIFFDSGSFLGCRDYRTATVNELGPREIDSGTGYSDVFYNPTTGTRYYITLDRDEAIGSYGQFRMRIYTDSARTTLVNTQTIALHTSKKDYRYVMAVSTWPDSNPPTKTGYIENLDLQEVVGLSIPIAMYHYQHNTGSGL